MSDIMEWDYFDGNWSQETARDNKRGVRIEKSTLKSYSAKVKLLEFILTSNREKKNFPNPKRSR